MAEVGTYYITIMPSMSKFTGEVKRALGDLGSGINKSVSTSLGDIIKGSAIGTMLGKLGSALGSEIMSGLSTGIGRLDTIKNFPKVMESLGYSSTQADRSIQEIMQHLDGLPSATQDVVTLTQAIADSTGDLDLATKAALGFNDMMLANGSSTAEVTQAQGVLNRVLGKGNATVAQWQSLQSVMPAQLAAVARELMGEGASVEGLRDQLNDGTISWNDFLQAIVRLDTEGNGHMASFYDQAVANSHGIGTALANVQNRIGAGWADILDSIGREDISSAIDTASYGIRDAMTRVGDAIEWLKWTILGSSIDESLGRIFGDVKDFFKENFSIDVPDLKNFTRDLVDLVESGLKWIADHGDEVGTALAMIAGAFAALEGIKIGAALSSAFTALQTFLGGLSAVNVIGLGAIGLIGALAAGLWYFFTQTEQGQKIWSDFKQLLSTTWESLKQEWADFTAVLSREWQSFKDFIGGLPEWWQGVKDGWAQKLEETKTAVAEKWESIKTDTKAKWEDIKSDAKTAWENLKTSVTERANAAKTNVANAWSNLKTNTKQAWEDLKTNTKQAWENLKTSTAEKANSLKTSVSTAWNNLKTDTRAAWENIKTSATEKVNSMKTAVTSSFDALKNGVKTTWESIKTAISDKITAAKNKVRDMVNAIKGLFNFKISWPHIPLPHFSVSGSANPLDWLTGGVPHFSVSWYAKGGIFDGATLIGVGEKGPEAVLPLNDRTMGGIADLIANKMQAAPSVVMTGNTFYVRKESDIDAIADAIARRAARQRESKL